METTNTKNWRQELFNYMESEHNVRLLESDMDQIQRICYPPDYPYIASQPAPAGEIEKTIELCNHYKWQSMKSASQIIAEIDKKFAPAGEMTAEENLLAEFRKYQHENFDEEGKLYRGVGLSANTAELMLKIINSLASQKKGQESKE